MMTKADERYFEIKEMVEFQIASIDKIEYPYKILCIYALIECFSQEYANYPSKGTENVFCNFILSFQSSVVAC